MQNKNKWPKPTKQFSVPIYGGMVYLYNKPKDFSKARMFLGADATNNELLLGQCHHLQHNKTGESVYLIGWFNKSKSTLIHEIAHAAMFILQHVGIDPRDSAGEVYCYLFSELLDKFEIDK